ncbi:spinster family MFS transporter [Paraburkholderia nemoris]|uniref:spinster family MFS transporter n=1 Tax=Paraburkholderia nemoris TaxID=2793076 RepID=UPI0038B80E4A
MLNETLADVGKPGSSIVEYSPAPQAWYVVGVLLVAYTFSFVDRLILSLMVRPVRADLHLSDTGISLLQGLAFAIFYTLVGLFLGRWADRHNRVKLVIAGIIVWCAATVACGFAANFTQLFVARIFVGVGEAALSPAAYSLISDLFPKERRGRAVGLYGTGIFLGSGLALLFGGLAVHALEQASSIRVFGLREIAPWRAAFIVVGLAGSLAVVLMTTVREPSRKETTADSARFTDFVTFVASRRAALGGVILNNACIATTNFCLAAWLPTYFIRSFGWTAPQIAGAYGAILLSAGCGGMVIGGLLADRLVRSGHTDGAMSMIRRASIPISICVAWFGLAASPTSALSALIAATFFLGIPTALGPAAAHAIVPNQFRGQTVALLLLAANVIGLGIGPTLVALLTDYVFRDDAQVGKSLTCVLLLASAIGLILVWTGRRAYRSELTAQANPILSAANGQAT